jgi:predicted  nucleic acid-binding Zn-ribbon protein
MFGGDSLFVEITDDHIRQIHQRMEVLFGIPVISSAPAEEHATLEEEVEQRIRERDHFAEQSNQWIAEVTQLKAEVTRLGNELNTQCQAHHEARERFKAEIKAAHLSRSAAAEGYRSVIKELTAERDAAVAKAMHAYKGNTE